jgi:predicted component of type VI protein secretion system
MSLEPGSDRWALENLSSTNPVAVNGADILQGAPPMALSDGDRVEMGEIVFVFRAR